MLLSFRPLNPSKNLRSPALLSTLWQELQSAFPDALSAVLLPSQGHLLLPDGVGEEYKSRLTVLLRMHFPGLEWQAVQTPRSLNGTGRLIQGIRSLALLPCKNHFARSPLDWMFSTYPQLIHAEENAWIDAHRLQLHIGKRGPRFLFHLHRYVTGEPLSPTLSDTATLHQSDGLFRESPDTPENPVGHHAARLRPVWEQSHQRANAL